MVQPLRSPLFASFGGTFTWLHVGLHLGMICYQSMEENPQKVLVGEVVLHFSVSSMGLGGMWHIRNRVRYILMRLW